MSLTVTTALSLCGLVSVSFAHLNTPHCFMQNCLSPVRLHGDCEWTTLFFFVTLYSVWFTPNIAWCQKAQFCFYQTIEASSTQKRTVVFLHRWFCSCLLSDIWTDMYVIITDWSDLDSIVTSVADDFVKEIWLKFVQHLSLYTIVLHSMSQLHQGQRVVACAFVSTLCFFHVCHTWNLSLGCDE